ncbi:hypothetical protein EZV73_21450 [Acidaminobacter sp. JC074]|uniref:hypothetical protein n=1 Tax=Acidaminobacter sp. JC074 TaxID=2530199 RepID=UPI001F0D6815|nr:hypothetical protein [Acidaminobacter sp. JC074]MCH4890161.1 hypothetical protein [Acidaminobacter sp. JC074]
MKLRMDEVVKILVGFINVLFTGIVIYYTAVIGFILYAHLSSEMAYSIRMNSPLPALIFFAVFAVVYFIRKSKVMFVISLVGLFDFLVLSMLMF